MRQNNLRRIRRSHNISMMGLSVVSSVSTSTIVGIEKYNHYPEPSTREKLSRALRVSEREIWPNKAKVENDGK